MTTSNYGYFKKLRMAWIWEIINIYGYINRIHLERKFGISPQQASADFKSFMKRNPDHIFYNESTKQYELLSLKGL